MWFVFGEIGISTVMMIRDGIMGIGKRETPAVTARNWISAVAT
jgi:hypothetical protein